MCNFDNIERCELWHEKETKARKLHKCDCCYGQIEKGATYTRHFSKFEGYIIDEKLCAACQADRDKFAAAHGGVLCAPSDLKEMVHECVMERESIAQMLKWSRMLKQIDSRKGER